MSRKLTYDARCYDLADIFIDDTQIDRPDRCDCLAACIQETIDAWLIAEAAGRRAFEERQAPQTASASEVSDDRLVQPRTQWCGEP